MRRYGIDSALLVSNRIEALLAIGDWDEADGASAAALRAVTRELPPLLLILRADIEIGRGDFEAARAHLEAAGATLREDRVIGLYDAYVAELALWEHRWTDADAAIRTAWRSARRREAAQIRVQLCAKGLRAQAELAALARARRDADALRGRLDRTELLAVARRAAAEASAVTPNAAGWLALAEAEYERARGERSRERVGGGGGGMGAGRAPAARRVLPLAPGRGARRGRARPAPRRAHRCGKRTQSRLGSERSPAARARAARRACPARSRAARRRAARRESSGLQRSSG